ncbi:uncharacterized histidine-rich protein DDB_G0274557-like [Penaeus indicus]|uniref:uncharacterized histidine-rich protein DDB_G0274557-like n=1 Tax=Penaeus indicus TaxID=29960 RepID=UPI00300CDA3F
MVSYFWSLPSGLFILLPLVPYPWSPAPPLPAVWVRFPSELGADDMAQQKAGERSRDIGNFQSDCKADYNTHLVTENDIKPQDLKICRPTFRHPSSTFIHTDGYMNIFPFFHCHPHPSTLIHIHPPRFHIHLLKHNLSNYATRLFSSTYIRIYPHIHLHLLKQQSTSIHINPYSHLQVPPPNYIYPHLPTSTHPYSPTSTYPHPHLAPHPAHLPTPIHTHPHLPPRPPTSTRTYPRSSTLTHIYPHLSTLTHTYPHLFPTHLTCAA